MTDADAVLFVVDADDRRHRGGRPGRRGRPPRGPSGCCSSPTRSTTPAARPPSGTCSSLGLGEPLAGLGPARPRHRRPPRRARRRLPRADATSRRRRRATDAGADRRRRRRRHLRRRHRRPAERRQVDAVQPPHRRRAGRRPRPARHDARHRRHRRRDRRRPDPLRRHRRDAPSEPRSTRAPSTTRSCGRCRPSTAPTSPCSSSTPPRASPPRTSGWPSASTPPAARSSCVLNKWELLDAEERDDVSEQVGRPPPLRRRGAGAHRVGAHRQGRAPPAARRSATPSTPTTGGCRPGRSTRSCGRPRPATPRPTAPGSSTPPRARPTRRRSRCSPTASCRARTCATSRTSCERPSTWAPRRSACACAVAAPEPPRPEPGRHARPISRRNMDKPILAVVAVGLRRRRASSGGDRPGTCARSSCASSRRPAPTATPRSWPAASSARSSTPRSCTRSSALAVARRVVLRPRRGRRPLRLRPRARGHRLRLRAGLHPGGAPLRGPRQHRAPGRGGALPGGAGAPALGRAPRPRRAARRSPGFDIGRIYVPGTGLLAGDFYDVYAVAPTRLAVVIGDVTGHGIEPSITAFQAKELLRVFLGEYRDPAQALEVLNQRMSLPRPARGVRVDPRRRVRRRRRHAPVRLGRPPRRAGCGTTATCTRCGRPGPLLLLDPEAGVPLSRELPIDVDDLLLVYTDGLAEARDGQAQFGEERIGQTSAATRACDAAGPAASRSSRRRATSRRRRSPTTSPSSPSGGHDAPRLASARRGGHRRRRRPRPSRATSTRRPTSWRGRGSSSSATAWRCCSTRARSSRTRSSPTRRRRWPARTSPPTAS